MATLKRYVEAVWIHGQTGKELADCTFPSGQDYEWPDYAYEYVGEPHVLIVVDGCLYRVAAMDL